jgi:hypothetical protein
VTYVAAALSIAVFLVCFWLFRVVPAAARIVASAKGAFAALRDPALPDDVKEAAAQRASIALLRELLSLLLRGAAAVVASLAPLFAFDALGLAPRGEVFALLASWQAILATTSAMVIGLVFARRLRTGQNNV